VLWILPHVPDFLDATLGKLLNYSLPPFSIIPKTKRLQVTSFL
jgi:hypothetical protein